MSDDILTVTTPFADVVALAQGYLNRADGERLLLPLSSEQQEGVGVRFVVLLGDGTPAFAGAGLCVQVSDQGGTVAIDQRFETLLDSLQFDDRSRPVYDYIVAVRNAAYSQPGTAATEAAPGDAIDADLEALDGGDAHDDEATAIVSPGAMAAARAAIPSAAPAASEQLLWTPGTGENVEHEHTTSWAPSVPPAGAPSYQAPRMPSYAAAADPPMPSFLPPAIPTGILTRPARAAHWQPNPPRRPSARPASGLFRYPVGALPRPSRPPHPEIDPAQRVSPAERPAR